MEKIRKILILSLLFLLFVVTSCWLGGQWKLGFAFLAGFAFACLLISVAKIKLFLYNPADIPPIFPHIFASGWK